MSTATMNEETRTNKSQLDPCLEHFLALVMNGGTRHASSGEQAARRIAAVILDQAPLLDDRAIEGIKHFLGMAKTHPSSTRDALQL